SSTRRRDVCRRGGRAAGGASEHRVPASGAAGSRGAGAGAPRRQAQVLRGGGGQNPSHRGVLATAVPARGAVGRGPARGSARPRRQADRPRQGGRRRVGAPGRGAGRTERGTEGTGAWQRPAAAPGGQSKAGEAPGWTRSSSKTS